MKRLQSDINDRFYLDGRLNTVNQPTNQPLLSIRTIEINIVFMSSKTGGTI